MSSRRFAYGRGGVRKSLNELALLARRVVSFAIDWLILATVARLLSASFGLDSSWPHAWDDAAAPPSITVRLLSSATSSLLALGYASVLFFRCGATLGMALTGIQFVSRSEAPLRPWQCCVRAAGIALTLEIGVWEHLYYPRDNDAPLPVTQTDMLLVLWLLLQLIGSLDALAMTRIISEGAPRWTSQPRPRRSASSETRDKQSHLTCP